MTRGQPATGIRNGVMESIRCTAKSKSSGERCRKATEPGLTVCRVHGGKSPQLQKRITEAKILNGLARMVQPIAPDDWEANPLNSFEIEFRRTVAAIRYYDEKIAELEERDLIYGLQSEVMKDATEFPGVDTTMAAGLHQWEVARRWERQHLTDLHKLWITAKLDVRKLEISQRYVEHLDLALTAIISKLGKDPRDVEVRNVIRVELARLGPPGRTENER